MRRLSENESGDTGNGGEDGGANEGTSTGLLRRRRGRNGVVATGRGASGRVGRGSDLRRRNLATGGLLRLTRAGNLNGLGLDGGDGGDLLLGDVGGGVAGALRLLGLLRLAGSLGLTGSLRLAGGTRVLRNLRDGAVATGRRVDSGRRRLRSASGRTNGADSGADGDGGGHNNGGVSRAVSDGLGAVGDGVGVLRVDGGGGHGLRLLGLAGAVLDIISARDDGRDVGLGGSLGDRGLGVGDSAKGDGSDGEKHLV